MRSAGFYDFPLSSGQCRRNCILFPSFKEGFKEGLDHSFEELQESLPLVSPVLTHGAVCCPSFPTHWTAETTGSAFIQAWPLAHGGSGISRCLLIFPIRKGTETKEKIQRPSIQSRLSNTLRYPWKRVDRCLLTVLEANGAGKAGTCPGQGRGLCAPVLNPACIFITNTGTR